MRILRNKVKSQTLAGKFKSNMNGVSKVTWTFIWKKFIELSIFISEDNVVVFCKVSLQHIDSQPVVSTSKPYNMIFKLQNYPLPAP